MAYISNDGTVLKANPWGIKRVFGVFIGIFYMIMMFFRTLIRPNGNSSENDYSRDFRPGSGPPGPRMRRLGRPYTGDTVNIPYGGCSSCGG